MNLLKFAVGTAAAISLAAPSAAQVGAGFEREQFVSALQKGDGSKALDLLSANPTLVNARGSDGTTALIAAIEHRDPSWTGHLLNQGADPNLASRNGDTPLIAASRNGFQEAAEWLLGLGAKVNSTNKMGENALIVAVQRRHVPIVRVLLNAGADPDHTDSAAGYSARDYAKRDTRTPELLRLIEAKKPNP